MKYSSFLKNKKGLTLVELLVTLAVMSLVFLIAFMIFGFGQKTFAGGSRQYDLQSSIRLAEDYITKQIRYAPVVKVMDETKMNAYTTSNGGILPYENFIYYDTSQKCIIHWNAFFTKKLYVGEGGEIYFSSTSTSTSPSNEIYYQISGESSDKGFDVENSINCLNVHLSSANRITHDLSMSGNSGDVLYFKSNDDFMAERLKPLVELVVDTLNDKYNNLSEFNIKLAVGVSGYTIISPTGTGTPSVNLTNGNTEIEIRPTSNAPILFNLEFSGGIQYSYMAVFNGTDWTIK